MTQAVHFGATSQDVIDTGLVLRLKPVIDHSRSAADRKLIMRLCSA